MAKIHDLFIIELAEVIKGYGNDPDVEDPFRMSEFYRFYELPNIAVSRENFEKMRPAQQEQRWIPCSERLPEEYGEFLVTMTEKAKAKDLGFDIDETYIRKMRYNSNGWQLPRHIPSWINEAVKDEVLAWMPLPEPYREERTDE